MMANQTDLAQEKESSPAEQVKPLRGSASPNLRTGLKKRRKRKKNFRINRVFFSRGSEIAFTARIRFPYQAPTSGARIVVHQVTPVGSVRGDHALEFPSNAQIDQRTRKIRPPLLCHAGRTLPHHVLKPRGNGPLDTPVLFYRAFGQLLGELGERAGSRRAVFPQFSLLTGISVRYRRRRSRP